MDRVNRHVMEFRPTSDRFRQFCPNPKFDRFKDLFIAMSDLNVSFISVQLLLMSTLIQCLFFFTFMKCVKNYSKQFYIH